MDYNAAPEGYLPMSEFPLDTEPKQVPYVLLWNPNQPSLNVFRYIGRTENREPAWMPIDRFYRAVQILYPADSCMSKYSPTHFKYWRLELSSNDIGENIQHIKSGRVFTVVSSGQYEKSAREEGQPPSWWFDIKSDTGGYVLVDVRKMQQDRRSE